MSDSNLDQAPVKRDPLDAARRKGREAAQAGLPASACPYQDKRKDDGRLTFSRAWRNAWFDGYRSVGKGD